MAINIQDIASSAYSIIQAVQQQATEAVGLDSMYFRATPHQNSEDAVVFQEYTLYNVEDCGQQLKVVMTDNSYQGGDFTTGLFGVEFPSIPEAQIALTEWQKVYPMNTQPQKNDIIYIQMLHKLFEVSSSTVVYTIGERPMYFKLSLQKYTPQASRRENEDLRSTIEEMTVNQEDIFGETISQEVADAVVEVETAYNTTSSVDPMKDFDISSVVYDPLTGPAGVTISNAYYDMMVASKPVVYHTPASYSKDSERPVWMFSCWFTTTENARKKKQYSVRGISYYSEDNKFKYYAVDTPLKLKNGDTVTITKGALISITGEITELKCEVKKIVKFQRAEVQLLEKRIKDWYKTGPFKIMKSASFSLLKSVDNATFDISVMPDRNRVKVTFGNFIKEVSIGDDVSLDAWTYIMAGLTDKTIKLFIEQLTVKNQKIVTETVYTGEINANIKKAGDFEFNELSIPCNGTPVKIRNIRLYESEYLMTDDIAERDALTEVSQNASKLIVVDAPNVAQKGDFYSPAR